MGSIIINTHILYTSSVSSSSIYIHFFLESDHHHHPFFPIFFQISIHTKFLHTPNSCTPHTPKKILLFFFFLFSISLFVSFVLFFFSPSNSIYSIQFVFGFFLPFTKQLRSNNNNREIPIYIYLLHIIQIYKYLKKLQITRPLTRRSIFFS